MHMKYKLDKVWTSSSSLVAVCVWALNKSQLPICSVLCPLCCKHRWLTSVSNLRVKLSSQNLQWLMWHGRKRKNCLSSEFRQMFQREVPLFSKIPESLETQSRISHMYPICQNQLYPFKPAALSYFNRTLACDKQRVITLY